MTNKEIETFNKTFGIETVFYYDDKSICGYEENNAIYLNLNSKKDLKNVNMHELLHFFEETEMFSKIKERVIKRLKENNIFDKFYTDQCYNMDPNSATSWYSAPGRNIQVGIKYTL